MTFSTPIVDNSPAAILALLGVKVPKGTVRCTRCHKAMSGSVCGCIEGGNPAAYIYLYHKGQYLRYFRYHLDNLVFDYSRAVKQLAEINLKIEKGEFRPSEWTPEAVKARRFDSQVEKWLTQKNQEKEAGEFAPATLRAYRGYADNHYLPFFGKMNVSEISFQELEEFKDSLASKGIGIKTRRNLVNGLRAFFSWMHRKGIIKAVPPFPTVEGDDSRLMRALTLTEQGEGLQRLSEAHRDVFSFGFEQGLRPGELCALKVKDLELHRAMVCIQRTYSGAELKRDHQGEEQKVDPPQ